jgi:hypothetical protein
MARIWKGPRSKPWLLAGALVGTLLLPEAAPAGMPTPTAAGAAKHWIDGDAASALSALDASSGTREDRLNAAVVRLYSGNAAEAAGLLTALRGQDGRWTPSLRWLARAQAELGRPEASDTASALLDRADADVFDRLWAGELFLDQRRPQQARAAFQAVVRENAGIDRGWRGLAAAETQLGLAEATRTAERGIAAVRGPSGSPVVPVAGQPPPGRPNWSVAGSETLSYEVRYLFVRLASVRLETEPFAVHRGTRARRVVFTAKSNPGIPFFQIDSRFESLVSEDGAVLAHRHVASDSDNGADDAAYDMDAATGRCVVRTVSKGVYGYHRLPLPANAQDGVSVLLFARALARTRGSAVVPTAVDSMWWPTQLRTLGVETIRWRGREVRAVRMQSIGQYRGAGGLSGAVDIWFSDDDRALPYRVKMKVAVGSVVLELLPDASRVDPAVARNEVAR